MKLPFELKRTYAYDELQELAAQHERPQRRLSQGQISFSTLHPQLFQYKK